MVEIGWFSHLPHGFCVIGPKAHKLKGVRFQAVIEKAEKQFLSIMEERRKEIERQEPIFIEFLQRHVPDFTSSAW